MPVVAAAAITGVAGIASASIQSSAAKKAVGVQADAANKSLAFEQTARDDAKRVLTPYSEEGAKARQKYNDLIGLGGHAATAGSEDGADWNAYLSANPDVTAAYQRFGQGMSAEDFAKQHYEQYGRTEGRALPGSSGPIGAVSQDDAQAAAMGDFHKSPFYTTTRASGKAGADAILSTQAASGRGIVSGKAARAVADWTNENEQQALNSYLSSLSGVADTGFAADSGIASGGQTFANAAANTTAQAANAQAAGITGSAKAIGEGIGDIASSAGFVLGAKNGTFGSSPAAGNPQRMTQTMPLSTQIYNENRMPSYNVGNF